MPGLLGKIKKKLPFCALFWVPRFSYFLNKYHTDRHQTWLFMPVGTYNATDMVELKRERLFEVSTYYVRCTRKNTVFDNFFHKLTKRITSESDTAGKMGPTCCPTIRSTGINPQLVLPVGYKALTVLQFWIFFGPLTLLCSRNVRELFSTLVTDTLTKFSALTLIFVVVTKKHSLFG